MDEEIHYPTRPVDKDKAEQELVINIKKATSPEETAPKQKHVRKCIVFTWDYHSSISFWSGLRVQPILSDEVQTFKALITVHKVLQEGHPNTLKEAHGQTAWLETCARTVGNDGMRGYGPLIRTYVQFLLAKLRFHRLRPEFNGLFEYEEYITLKGIDDPNEGGSTNNECRISSLVPLVKESWAMYRRTNDGDVLEPLRLRYVSQHHSLRKFYYECSNLKYLTGLINVPKLGQEPPNLMDSGDAPDLPARPKTVAPKSPSPPPAPSPDASAMNEQVRMLKEYEEQQAALVAAREAEERRRQELEAQQQREFEQRQREQAENQRLAQEQLMLQQQAMYNNQAAQQLGELERELLAMRGQYERDQIFLEQYDRRVKALEAELAGVSTNIGSQMASKDELIKQLQDQVTLWRNKYEALAKLYSQLRSEHLDMLSKFKQMQLKANSAQEAVDRMERMERDLKAKNLELADMLRERDRARFDVDRSKSTHKEEMDRLRRELNFANERADDASRSKNSEVSGVLSKYNRQISELEDSLRDQEIEILNAGMDNTLKELDEAQQNQGLVDDTTNAQIDNLILDNHSILQACVQKVDEAIYELESLTQAGNLNSTPEYTLSMIEKAMNNANEFSTIYNLYLGEEEGGEHVDVIKSANEFAQSLADVLINTKGVTRLASDDDASDKLIGMAKNSGDIGLRFFMNLQSYKVNLLKPSQRTDVAMRSNSEIRGALTKLSENVDKLIPKGAKSDALARANGNIGDIVEHEMSSAALAIEAATQRLQELMARPRDTNRFSAVDIQVHDSILAAAMAITNAIARLIKAATESQQEIVAEGKGSSSMQQFYKRNNRWTEGLISAAKAVAFATNLLIESADGVLSGTHSLEQLIVASNEVAAATAQLVAASRVKANLMSKTQERLELAAKAVTEACRALVRQVKAVAAKQAEEEPVDYQGMATLEFKKREMEQQVEILKLEKELGAARHRLGAMRRAGYHTDETD
ncbi:ANTH-domain-containing protein [Gymnopus androsaceus JB14]|uniref:ANTH-domain-containing protein n=1 Tax=Gymnopus androsaceus JB14 TaxID=1447944 RepID=A0A6A4HS30_9AGAR|nr:ANTH-domain-containing protein [Gymnopus androsaceus JB14]